MAGRPPTPISQHKTRGTYRKGRHEGKLDVPDESLGPAPEWCDEIERAEWERIAALPHIKAAHRVVVEQAVVLYGRFRQDRAGTRNMPASEGARFHSVYMQLGLTPASQAKIPAAPNTASDDVWAKLG